MAEALRVGVVGTGYVGLVTGTCLAFLGHRVTCVDRDEERVRGLRSGRMPVYEPGLEELVARGAGRESLDFAGTKGLSGLVEEADVLFVAVGTPQGEDGAADLSGVAAVARGIGGALARGGRHTPLVVVNKSTVPVGSGDYVSMLIRDGIEEEGGEDGAVPYSSVAAVARGIGGALAQGGRERPLVVVNKSTVPVGSGDYVSMLIRDGIEEEGGEDGAAPYRVVSNPEFLREGTAVYDTLFPDRIVAGSDSREALDTLRVLYEPIIEQSFPTERDPRPKVVVPFVTTDLASAEMIKYAANAFLATKISFINEVANLCELVGADVGSVAYGIGLDERIGSRFLSAGIGWGGSCFPKDVAALRSIAREYEHETPLLDATVAVNERQRKQVIGKLQRDLHTLKGKRVALLGLSFKPNTDDLREAPSLQIARSLDSLGARVVGYDPVAGKAAAREVPALKVVFDPYEAFAGAHAAVVATEWEEVRSLDLARAASLMQEPRTLVDGRNVLDPVAAAAAGLSYRGFGRG